MLKQRILTKAIKILSSFGEGRECPICGWTGLQFAPRTHPRKPSADALCPRCHSHERHRLLWFVLKDRMGSRENALHFAPEVPLVNYLKERVGSYRSCDITPGRAMDQEDLTSLTYANGQFDFIMCNHVLEHIHDDQSAIRELYRVLSEDGLCVLSVPLWRMNDSYEDETITDPAGREDAFGQVDHVRLYGLTDFVSRLKNAGFAVETISVRDFDPKVVGRHGLNYLTTGEIFLCTKR